MIERIAGKLTDKFINNNIIKADDKQIYNYCFEATIAIIINYTILLLLSIFFKEIASSFVFLTSFLFFRKICGGYHANNYLNCEIMSIFSYIILIILIKKFDNIYTFSTVLLFTGLIIIIFISPIQNDNKPFTEKQYKRFKVVSKSCATLLLVIFGMFEICGYHNLLISKYFFSFCYGIDLVAFSLLMSKLERRIKSAKT